MIGFPKKFLCGVKFSDPKVPKPNSGIKMVPIPSSSVGFWASNRRETSQTHIAWNIGIDPKADRVVLLLGTAPVFIAY